MITGYNADINRIQSKLLEIRNEIMDLQSKSASRLTGEQKEKLHIAREHLDDLFNQLCGSYMK